MARNNPLDDDILRIRLVMLCLILAFAGLGFALWNKQVASGHRYVKDQMKQSIRRVRMPGIRGRLYDRNGVCLADNRPSYDVALYLEELRQPGRISNTINKVDSLIKQLSNDYQLPSKITREDIQQHIRRRLPLPLIAWRDVGEEVLAKLAEQQLHLTGIDVHAEAVRYYPMGTLASHVLGYVGRADIQRNEEDPYHYYLPEVEGKTGLEKTLDKELRGEAGGRLVRIDVVGFRRHDVGQREPKPGNDILLTLDQNIQRWAEEALGEDPGAVAVVDPRNGDVLALASSPGFDPNQFIPSISVEAWRTLSEDERKPLLNRAVAGAYPPGSTFKPVVAMAALESKKITGKEVYSCPGYFQLGRATFRCWLHSGHGTVDLHKSIEQSCNVYFFHTGLQCGYEYIYHMAEALGLGRKTGVELGYESAGLLPSEGWKKRIYNDGWRDGDTCNASIGQGYLTVTPLQMAMVTAAFANGGRIYRPRLVMGSKSTTDQEFSTTEPELINQLHWDPKHLEEIQDGMRAVVMEPHGSGRRAAVAGVTMAGKTGTAEFGRRDDRKKHAWMILYAPVESPRYAVAMLVDEGMSGGETIAPRMHKLMGHIFQTNIPPAEGQG